MSFIADDDDSSHGLPSMLNNDNFRKTLDAAQRINESMKHPAQGGFRADVANDANAFHDPYDGSSPRMPNQVQVSNNKSLRCLDPTGTTQEVTQYCTIAGCNWSSFKTNDPKNLEACVNQHKNHILSEHSGAGDSQSYDNVSGARADRSAREYKNATQKRMVQKTVDDAVYNLSDARFFTTPLDLKVIGVNMPTVAAPINTVVDFNHMGVQVLNQDTLRKVHNRANSIFKLRECSKPNLNTYHHQGEELTPVEVTNKQFKLGIKQKELESPKECLEAFFNYLVIHTNFHPLDWSPKALFHVALEKYLEGPPTVAQFKTLFDRFINDNAIRAQKKAPPLTYSEILSIWQNFIAPTPMNNSCVEALVRKELQLQGFDTKNHQSNSKRRNDARVNNSIPKKPKAKVSYCPNWNASKTAPLCSNTQTDGGCIDENGTALVHSCTAKTPQGKFCGSSNHGYQWH